MAWSRFFGLLDGGAYTSIPTDEEQQKQKLKEAATKSSKSTPIVPASKHNTDYLSSRRTIS